MRDWAAVAELTQLRNDKTKLLAELAELRENPRDEHHTMEELYDYRLLYNAALFNEWAHHGSAHVVKSWRHSDGEPCFGGGWFVVVAQLPTGQISNHYREEHWNLFAIDVAEFAPMYDGHTPAVAAERLRAVVEAGALF